MFFFFFNLIYLFLLEELREALFFPDESLIRVLISGFLTSGLGFSRVLGRG